MLNILINAYAVAPNWGSEPGMAWNWCSNLARYCELFIITEGEWKEEIEKAIKTHPYGKNMHFYYNPVPQKVRDMCWNQGDWRFYFYYRKWQKKTLEIAQQICKEHKIDVIHQLNMVGFREPGLLWEIKGIPFVWGPVGGMENIPTSYLKNVSWKQNLFCRVKNTINTLQYSFQPSVRKAIKHSDIIISAVKGVEYVLKNKYGKQTTIIPETGIKKGCVPIEKMLPKEDGFNLLWVGRFISTKKLDIALQTIAKLKHLRNIKLHIVGFGMNDEDTKYKNLAKELGIEEKCIWYSKLDNAKVMELMQRMDIFFFTSIMEATSTVTLEAIQNRLPIVCHDTCGFGNIVNDSIGRKIELRTPQDSINDFAKIIEELYSNRDTLTAMRPNFDKVAEELTYEAKAKKMVEIYNTVVKTTHK